MQRPFHTFFIYFFSLEQRTLTVKQQVPLQRITGSVRKTCLYSFQRNSFNDFRFKVFTDDPRNQVLMK